MLLVGRHAFPIAALLWLGSVGAAIGGCNNTDEAILRALGEGCLIDSDCVDGLTCAFRRCHQPCETSKDCPQDDKGRALLCMLGDKPANVCQLDDEGACDRHSDCPGGQLCALDDRCRDGCESDRDCVAEQVCRSATCADFFDLDNDQLTPTSPDRSLDKPCQYASDCPPGPDDLTLLCTEGHCTFACYVQRDCARFHRCTTADDPAVPGDCVLIGPRGALHCDPEDGPQPCGCIGDEPAAPTGAQTCREDGSGFEPCICG